MDRQILRSVANTRRPDEERKAVEARDSEQKSEGETEQVLLRFVMCLFQ